MSELKKIDTVPNPVCDPNNNLGGHYTLDPREEVVKTPEYNSECPYDNFIEASVRYSMASNENMRMKAASRAFYYLSSISRERGSERQRPELFDLCLFNTAYTALYNDRAYRELANQCALGIHDEELRAKAMELTTQGQEVYARDERVVLTAGSIATQGAVAS